MDTLTPFGGTLIKNVRAYEVAVSLYETHTKLTHLVYNKPRPFETAENVAK